MWYVRLPTLTQRQGYSLRPPAFFDLVKTISSRLPSTQARLKKRVLTTDSGARLFTAQCLFCHAVSGASRPPFEFPSRTNHFSDPFFFPSVMRPKPPPSMYGWHFFSVPRQSYFPFGCSIPYPAPLGSVRPPLS